MRTIVSVDRSTGEVVEGTLVLAPPRKRNGFQGGWIAMGTNPLVDLAKLGLGAQTYSVALAVLGTVGWGNEITLSQADVARVLGLVPQNVNRAWKELERHGIVRRGTIERAPAPPKAAWFLNPHLAWKGEAKRHRQAMNEWDAGVPPVIPCV